MISRLTPLLLALTAAAPFDPFGAARIDEKPGAAIPLDGAFQDAEGHSTSLRRIAGGKVLVVVPVLHDCPNLCGVTLAGVANAIAAQHRFAARRDFTVVAFGIDPKELPSDAAADLARLRAQRSDLTPAATVGSQASIRQVTDALGYHYAYDPRIGQYAHAAASAVLTPDGRLVRWIYGLNPDPGDLTAAIADAQAGRTGGLLQQLILLCYHYDPQTGAHTLTIERVVQAAGLVTVLLLGGLIVMLRQRWA
ncbi:SCO family protein [Novosphingobium sp. 9U]|uniref:SCO family protein n=1 Tax=Novosphingobium sp. 9U TaxID=2653158 RepID=UPI0012EFAB77|nr:SCO family protein [Novosphingobium sp. 9U]VWX47352.1 conserved hypothetical protein [Novosphingobium sp. 9U]